MTAEDHPTLVIPAGSVVLRAFRGDDVPWLFEACQDPEIQRWTTVPRPFLAHDAVEIVTNAADSLRAGTEHRLCIADAERDEALGFIGLKPIVDGRAEIGYWLAPDGRGRGAATEALLALADWSSRELGVVETYLRISPGNVASIALARRCGYIESAREIGSCNEGDAITDALVFTRPARAW
jgi:[ribosomal protein S5]-alanine N-acetyltransferase